MKQRLKRYCRNLLIALDQLANTLLAGWPDETLSARAHRKAQAGQWFWRTLRRLIDLIFFREKDHCRLSYENERERRHCPAELRGDW